VTKANMPVSIRPLRNTDAVEWRRLWTDYLTFYKTTLPETIKDSTFARLLDPKCPDLNGLVAEQDDNLIGLTHYIFHRHGWRLEDTVYLQDLFVDPAARGTGCGRGLIEAVYAEADKAGTPSVYWLTQSGNAAGRLLYERVGTPTDFIKYQRPAA
jgi:GNAT superfamily N-acetyltransferase